MDKPKQITLSTLKERGWTDGSIKKFLGEPDELLDNPHYKKGPPMRLYRLDRVEKVEATEKFQEWKTKSESRRTLSRQIMLERHQKKREDVMAWARAIKISVEKYNTREDLLKAACQHYNWLQSQRDKEGFASIRDDDEFLYRIAVNFLRHTCTPYEELLEDKYGETGVDEARWIIRGRCYDIIAEAYPYLADECHRQMRVRMVMD